MKQLLALFLIPLACFAQQPIYTNVQKDSNGNITSSLNIGSGQTLSVNGGSLTLNTGTIALTGGTFSTSGTSVNLNGWAVGSTTITGSGSVNQSAGTVATVAAMEALTVANLANGNTVDVAGYRANADGGGGQFVYLSGSTATVDGGTIFAPNSGSGRFIRNYAGPLHTKWFGCYGDNSHSDATAFQAAVTASANNILFIDPGAYLIGSTITLPVSIHILGPSMRGSQSGSSSTGANLIATFAGPVLSFNPGSSMFADIEMEHFQITGNAGTYGSGDGVFFGTNVAGGGFMHNMTVSAFGRYGLNISSAGGFYAKDVYSAQNTTANFYNKAEYAKYENCQGDGSTYTMYVDNGGDGTNIIGPIFEGAGTSEIYTVSGATDVCVLGGNINMTAGGIGVDSNANGLRCLGVKIKGSTASSTGVYLSSTSASNIVLGNTINIGGASSIGVDDEGSGQDTIGGGLVSGGATGLKLNPSTYPDTLVSGTFAGPTNSVLQSGGSVIYAGWYDNGSGGYKQPTISGGTAFSLAVKGTFTCVAGAATVSNSFAKTNCDITFTMVTPGGTITFPPAIQTFTSGTGFTVQAGSGDTSTYQYTIINNL
jgi:hypothetical protein